MQYDYLTLYVTSANNGAQTIQLQYDNLTNYVVVGFHAAIKPDNDPNASSIVELLSQAFSNIFPSTLALSN
ncbi:hypothetical protein IKS57_01170 [bacterium]|nr:hypothetical protein [bacterium]